MFDVRRSETSDSNALPSLDFFAGSGLTTEGLRPFFQTVWANDICEKKARVYAANHGDEHFHVGPIQEVHGTSLPTAVLSWASSPCQDLSLAGKLEGIEARRSGLVWEWLRVTDEMPKLPAIMVMENVLGLVSAARGAQYRPVHAALVDRGYRVGPMVLNAVHWVPQSRPRVFVVAVRDNVDISGLASDSPNWNHPETLREALSGLENVVWWSLPKPRAKKVSLSRVLNLDEPTDDRELSRHNINLIPPDHLRNLRRVFSEGLRAVPGYKRIRNSQQVLELRFDDIAGCLRTPQGGSSRQHLVIRTDRSFATRLLTVREAATLMGAPARYEIPGSYNDGYRAMGDAVVVPVVRHLAKYLLHPLAERANGTH